MTLGSTKQGLPVVALLGLAAASLGGLLLLPPIPQDQSYHQFADQRALFGTPNFWNVVSNLPFLAVGAAGLRRRSRDDPATVVFFLGVFLTGIGSSYYHWNPNDGTFFWDRLPMTLAFAAILAIVIASRFANLTAAIEEVGSGRPDLAPPHRSRRSAGPDRRPRKRLLCPARRCGMNVLGFAVINPRPAGWKAIPPTSEIFTTLPAGIVMD